MKFLPFLLLITTAVISQNNHNFIIDNTSIIWTNEYKTTKSINEIFTSLKISGAHENLELIDQQIIGNIKPINIDFKHFGKSEFTTSMYVARRNYTGFFTIKLEGEKYVITLKKISGAQAYNDGLFELNQKQSLESLVLNNKNTLKKVFIRKDAELFDYSFNQLFQLK